MNINFFIDIFNDIFQGEDGWLGSYSYVEIGNIDLRESKL